MTNLLNSLQKTSLFSNKDSDEIRYLLSKISYKLVSFKENEIIFSPHKKANNMGIIISGVVHIEKIFPSGKVVVVNRKEAFELIAEPSLFSKSEYYPTTVSVCEPAEIFLISKDQLLKIFDLDPIIMHNFLSSVSDSMLFLKNKIGLLSLHSIRERVADSLITFYNESENLNITLPFSKKIWAEYMNVSRTSLSRELRKLETENILKFDRQKIQILDIEKLENILL